MAADLLHNSARVLEFDSLRELLRGYASSPLGQSRIAALAPAIDRDWIESQQDLTQEIREFRRVGGRFDFAALLEVTPLVQEARLLQSMAYQEGVLWPVPHGKSTTLQPR